MGVPTGGWCERSPSPRVGSHGAHRTSWNARPTVVRRSGCSSYSPEGYGRDRTQPRLRSATCQLPPCFKEWHRTTVRRKLLLLATALGPDRHRLGGPRHERHERGCRSGRDDHHDRKRLPTGTPRRGQGLDGQFIFVNKGSFDHGAFIGDAAAQDAHELNPAAAKGMNHGRDAVMTMKPGTSGTMSYAFETAGSILDGCHEPGRYPAGMRLTVDVA